MKQTKKEKSASVFGNNTGKRTFAEALQELEQNPGTVIVLYTRKEKP